MKTFLLFLPLGLLAADLRMFDAKPGLWEVTTTTQTTSKGPMPNMPKFTEEQLAKIPPAQRANLETMMKGGAMPARSSTAKSCITPEQVKKGFSFDKDMPPNCKQTVVSSSSTKQQTHMECSSEKMNSSGDLTLERIDSSHIKGTMLSNVTGRTAMTMNMSFDAKWISSNCGEVKPRANTPK